MGPIRRDGRNISTLQLLERIISNVKLNRPGFLYRCEDLVESNFIPDSPAVLFPACGLHRDCSADGPGYVERVRLSYELFARTGDGCLTRLDVDKRYFGWHVCWDLWLPEVI
jgi:hypothetical protein